MPVTAVTGAGTVVTDAGGASVVVTGGATVAVTDDGAEIVAPRATITTTARHDRIM